MTSAIRQLKRQFKHLCHFTAARNRRKQWCNLA